MELNEQVLEFKLRLRTSELNCQRAYFNNAVNQLSKLLGGKSPSLIKQEIMEEEEDALVMLGMKPIPKTNGFDYYTNNIINIIIDEIFHKIFWNWKHKLKITYKYEKFNKKEVAEFFKKYKYKVSYRGSFNTELVIHIKKEESNETKSR